jgi:hypothetical protein
MSKLTQPFSSRNTILAVWRETAQADVPRLVGAVSAVALGTALERGGTMTAASG